MNIEKKSEFLKEYIKYQKNDLRTLASLIVICFNFSFLFIISRFSIKFN